ncbi:MAG: hypothetical protein ACQGVC_23180 [Myxococcota bacterium]
MRKQEGISTVNKLAIAIHLLALLGFSAAAGAGDFDGSKKLLCAPGEAVDCMARGECVQVSPIEMNLPRFITVDARAKRLSGTPVGGEEQTTDIQNVQTVDGKLILQGAENGRGWSMVIDQTTGDLSAAVADQTNGFVLFGVCTPQ